MKKDFPIGAALSIVTGRLVSENHIAGVYDILNWMTGEDVFTHQIPRLIQEAKPVILAMHPHLAEAEAEAEQFTAENSQEWWETWKGRYGATIAVPQMTITEHERIDPMSELAEKVPPDRIAVVARSEPTD